MEAGDRSTIGFTVEEVKDQARLLVEWRVAKVGRECNLVAHKLASFARRNTHTAVRYGWVKRLRALLI